MEGSHWLHTGDGEKARIIDVKERDNLDGNKETVFMLQPTQSLLARYPSLEYERDDNGFIIRDFPSFYVEWPLRSMMKSVCWVFVDFNGDETVVSKRDGMLTEQLDLVQRLLKNKKTGMFHLMEELKELMYNYKESSNLWVKYLNTINDTTKKNDDETAEEPESGG